MSKKDDIFSLQHMIDHARLAVDLSDGRNRVELETDALFRLAMIRAVEVVGEAATRLSPDFRMRWQEIPWTEIIGARHRLIHGYDQISSSILWDILRQDMPDLLVRLESILAVTRSEREETP